LAKSERRKMLKKVFIFICSIFLITSCSRLTKHDGLLIAVSIPPQAWFVSQIAGEYAESIVLVGPGQNPHNYEPTPKQIQSLSTARAWILSGTEFEIGFLPKVRASFPKLLIIDGTEGVNFRLLQEHGDNGDNNYSSLEIDRHTWLGREPAKILARHVKDTLCRLDKKNEEFYTLQYDSLIDLIDDEFELLKMTLAPLEGRSVFVYHPSFGYFLDEFGINQEAVETGGKEPGPRVLNNLIAKVRQENAAAIFVQAQFPVNAAKTLADSVDAQLIILDPLAEDWLKNIQDMGQILQEASLQKAVP
jgi:zinc transport system substrate-binding protein